MLTLVQRFCNLKNQKVNVPINGVLSLPIGELLLKAA
jgi:hypothetical protein